jgi:hypothetical protein
MEQTCSNFSLKANFLGQSESKSPKQNRICDKKLFDSAITLNAKGSFVISESLQNIVNEFLEEKLDKTAVEIQLQQISALNTLFTKKLKLTQQFPVSAKQIQSLKVNDEFKTPIQQDNFVLTPKEQSSQKKCGQKSLKTYETLLDLTTEILLALKLFAITNFLI